MKILLVASEAVPFVKVGGLADVVGSLPRALHNLGLEPLLIIPKYGSIDDKKFNFKPTSFHFTLTLEKKAYPVLVFQSTLPGTSLPVYALYNQEFFQSDEIYGTKNTYKRFVFFSLAALELIKKLQWKPDVIHCHDWFTSIIPMKRKDLAKKDPFYTDIATVLTIHNLGYLGSTEPDILDFAGLLPEDFPSTSVDLEDNDIDLLGEGIMHADKINTVSRTYAQEILTKEFGGELTSVLQSRKKDLVGILNGIDYTQFNPEHDQEIIAQYSEKNTLPKKENKRELQKKSKLKEDDNIPVIGIVSRLVEQKGMHLITQLISKIKETDTQLVVLGTGDSKIEDQFEQAEHDFPDHVRAFLTFDLKRAREIYAGSDIFIVPSLYEPCGLTQMISMKYGSIPLVRKTGGLQDTVIDFHEDYKHSTGFVFTEKTSDALYRCIERAINVFRESRKDWEKLMTRAMRADFSWKESANDYYSLYKNAVQSLEK